MSAIEPKEYLVSYISPSGNQRDAIVVAESKSDARRTVQINEGIDTEFITIVEVDLLRGKVGRTDGKQRN
jgi:hypothetical protein